MRQRRPRRAWRPARRAWRVEPRSARLRSPGLRVRAAVAMSLLALVVSTSLSVLTSYLTRRYLVDQRQELAVRQTTLNAVAVQSALLVPDADASEVLLSLDSLSSARPLLRLDGEWFAATVGVGSAQLPERLLAAAEAGTSVRQRISIGGEPFVVIAAPLPRLGDAIYVEFVPLIELERTLGVLNRSLAVAALVTAGAGAIAGWWVAGRVLRPLGDIAEAARSISEGDLSTRLSARDADLRTLAEAFNDMAEGLEARISRESRFTSDVSHELRTPITAISAAVDLAQRGELSGRARMAVGMIANRVDHLRNLVVDLLEISRFDAGVVELDVQLVDVPALCREVVERQGGDPAVVHAAPGIRPFLLDRRRLERVITNLVDNAASYAGGVTRIDLLLADDELTISVEDCGDGILPDEREAIFGRFHRGRAANQPDSPRGTGLGLALVDEQVRLHGGTVRVTESPCGGARFEIRIPEATT